MPIAEDASVDLAFFSQALHHAHHPERAVAEAFRILKRGGRIVVLDLVRHTFEDAREMYADSVARLLGGGGAPVSDSGGVSGTWRPRWYIAKRRRRILRRCSRWE